MQSYFNKETFAPSIRYLLTNTTHEIPNFIQCLVVPTILFPLTCVEAEKLLSQLRIVKTKLFAQKSQVSNVTLVFRSSCRGEFWGKCIFRDTCPLIQISETFAKSVEKIPEVSLAATLLKMNFFSYFSRILISFQNSRFFQNTS